MLFISHICGAHGIIDVILLIFFSFCSAYKLAYKCIEIISEVGAFKQNRYITIFFYFPG